jgi:hypothetical protein
MDVTFRATPDMYLVSEAVVDVHRYPIRVLRVVGLVLTAVLATLAALGPDLFGISGAVVAFIFTMVAPAWFLRQGASSGARLICVDTEFTVGPAGVSTRTENRDVMTRWPIITDVVELPELVVLRMGPGSGLVIVPVDGLDDTKREQVLELIRHRGALSDETV